MLSVGRALDEAENIARRALADGLACALAKSARTWKGVVSWGLLTLVPACIAAGGEPEASGGIGIVGLVG